jgi:hypothetical protein
MTHQEKQKADGRRLQVRAESQQTAIAILHHELALVPWHVAKSPSEFHALGGVLGIKCVGIFNEQKKSWAKARPLQNQRQRRAKPWEKATGSRRKGTQVEQFVQVFVRIGGGRLGAAEMNHLLVARHDGVDRRILPRPQTFETKLACVIGECCGNVDSRAPVSTGDGEEHRRNLTEHGASLPQM